MFEDCLRLLKGGGMLIADNILYSGMVSGEAATRKKHRTSVEGLKKYLNEITKDKRLITSVVNFEDGLSISYKKEVKNETQT
jgi:predicted O-methyltransferase YrrM